MLSSPSQGYTEVVLLSGGVKAGRGSQEKQSTGELWEPKIQVFCGRRQCITRRAGY